MDFKLEIAKILEKQTNMPMEDVIASIETPPELDLGDFAFPCFRLAKELKKAPPAIAQEICEAITPPSFVDKIEAKGPYLNFYLKRDAYAKGVLPQVYTLGEDYGKRDIGVGQYVVIDYSSPNIAKPFHIGHLRSTVIGHALYNIFNKLGYRSYSINYLGDWGTQFGKIITAFERWSNKDEVVAGGIDALVKLYVRFHDEAEENPKLEDEARAWFLKMEQGDEYALNLWRLVKDISLLDYKKIYDLFEIDFDSYNGESFYNDKMTPVVEEIAAKGLLIEDKGAMLVDLEEHKMPPCLILRKDGGTLYATRDITSALYRKNEYNFAKAIYVTANEQNLHFAQFFKVVELMGYKWAKDELVHVPFGFMNLPEGKMSTRKGNVLLMEDLIDQTIEKVRETIEEKNPTLEDKEAVAQQVGLGAIIFNDLFNSRVKDVEFSWERMLSFEGETGPYALYTHARCCSVLEKASDVDYSDADVSLLTSDEEFELIKTIATFGDKIEEAANKYEPFVISRFIIAVAQGYNKFYHNNPILKTDEDLKKARLYLTHCVRDVLASALGILGIKAPSKM